MRTNFKFLPIAALALAVGFTSCSKDSGNDPVDGTTSKVVRLQVEYNGSKGVSDPIATAVSLTKGTVYFTNSAGAITSVQPIVVSEITNTAANEGQTFTVPASTTHVYMDGNVPTAMTSASPAYPTAPTLISEITGYDINVNYLYDATTSGVANVPLWGAPSTPITTTGEGTEASPYLVSFDISPIASRIELGGIAGNANITSFDVEGIFINNFFLTSKIDNTTSGTPVDNEMTVAEYQDGASGGYVGLSGLYDWNVTTTNTTNSVTPGSGKVWGYNVLPSATVDNVPHIVIRLKNVVTTDNTAFGINSATTYFITIKGYTEDIGGTDTPIASFKPRHVYRLGTLNFKPSDLAIEPETKPINVNVKVSVLEWIPVSVKPII